MTQDEIIEMARQAGFGLRYEGRGQILSAQTTTEKLEAFAKLVAERERERVEDLCMRGTQLAVLLAKAEEREACALVADHHAVIESKGVNNLMLRSIAGSIRARGEA